MTDAPIEITVVYDNFPGPDELEAAHGFACMLRARRADHLRNSTRPAPESADSVLETLIEERPPQCSGTRSGRSTRWSEWHSDRCGFTRCAPPLG